MGPQVLSPAPDSQLQGIRHLDLQALQAAAAAHFVEEGAAPAVVLQEAMEVAAQGPVALEAQVAAAFREQRRAPVGQALALVELVFPILVEVDNE